MKSQKRIAIFDTSVIDGEKNTDSFFGGRSELEKFSKICQIVIPDMVMEEIKKHKSRHILSSKSKFSTNSFRYLLNIDNEIIESLDIDKIVADLEESEIISHTVIKLSKPDALERIKVMCNECKPPFGENEDKGFKDAYILLTIEEFAESAEEIQIFVVVQDEKLSEALKAVPNLIVIRDFDEFEAFNKDYFTDVYFLERLTEVLEEVVQAEEILRADFNINDNWILEVQTEEKPTYVEVDFKNKEIIGFAKVLIPNGIKNLVTSPNFDTTDTWVEKMTEYVQYLNSEQMIELVEGAVENDQIYWIAEKDAVKGFFYPIFKKVESRLSPDLVKKFKKRFYEID